MDAAARIEALELENERLRGRLDQLEAQLGLGFVAPLQLRLTPAQARILGVLMARELATKDALMAALYRDLGRDEAEPKIIDVQICKMRPRLRAYGVEIANVWGQGYAISAAGKATIRALSAEMAA